MHEQVRGVIFTTLNHIQTIEFSGTSIHGMANNQEIISSQKKTQDTKLRNIIENLESTSFHVFSKAYKLNRQIKLNI